MGREKRREKSSTQSVQCSITSSPELLFSRAKSILCIARSAKGKFLLHLSPEPHAAINIKVGSSSLGTFVDFSWRGGKAHTFIDDMERKCDSDSCVGSRSLAREEKRFVYDVGKIYSLPLHFSPVCRRELLFFFRGEIKNCTKLRCVVVLSPAPHSLLLG